MGVGGNCGDDDLFVWLSLPSGSCRFPHSIRELRGLCWAFFGVVV